MTVNSEYIFNLVGQLNSAFRRGIENGLTIRVETDEYRPTGFNACVPSIGLDIRSSADPRDYHGDEATAPSPSPTRASILQAAEQAVTVDRAATHGDAENSFASIAGIWSAMLNTPVTPAQATLMMAGLKIARAWQNPGHADNWIDGAGYFACGGEIAGRAAQTTTERNTP